MSKKTSPVESINNIRSINEIKHCIKKLAKIERECRQSGDIYRAAAIRKAISQLKLAQRIS